MKFNATTATVTTWSATNIATTVPSGATTGERGGVCEWSEQQRIKLYCGASAEAGHHQPLADIRRSWQRHDDHGDEVRIEPGLEYGEVQWNGGNGDKLERDQAFSTVVPSGATTGNVLVTVGGVASDGSSFTVATLASLSVAPQNSSILAGNSQQFTGYWHLFG